VVNNPHYLINARPTDETISGVDRRDHACTLIGDLPIIAKDELEVPHRLTIRHVRCVPSISDSLLSILKLWDDEGSDCRFKDVNAIQTSSGLSFPFQREHGGTGLGVWTVQVQPRPRLTCGPQNETPPIGEHASTSTATAHLPDKRTPNPRWALSFRDEIHSSRASSVLAALDTNKLAQLLHQRLHIGTHLIRALPTLTADAPSKLAQASPSACPHWVAANATRLPHRGEIYRESTPGRLFFADIAGPFPPTTPQRFRYLLVLVDDHSRFKFAMGIVIVARSDAPATIARFAARWNHYADSNARITHMSRLHSDAAGEFRAAAFVNLLAHENIDKTFSPPEVHQANGVA
jgi:transposase InsO family protein